MVFGHHSNVSISVEEEIERYKSDRDKVVVDIEILHYWFYMKIEFFIKMKITRKLFEIPASSNEIERKFLYFNTLDVIIKKRNRMEKILSKTLCW